MRRKIKPGDIYLVDNGDALVIFEPYPERASYSGYKMIDLWYMTGLMAGIDRIPSDYVYIGNCLTWK